MAFSLNATFNGLNTLQAGVPSAGAYNIVGSLTLPSIPEGSSAQSQVVVTITQTPNLGSPTTIYTGVAGAKGFGVFLRQAAALDVFAITLSSSNAVDSALNAVSCTASVSG